MGNCLRNMWITHYILWRQGKNGENNDQSDGRRDTNWHIFILVGSGFVPQLVGDFLRTHEELEVHFRFTVGNTSEIIQGLRMIALISDFVRWQRGKMISCLLRSEGKNL